MLSLSDRPAALLITDADNTLYDFPSYYEAGIRAVIHEIQCQFRMSTAEAVASLKYIYLTRGNIEYPFAMEELPEAGNLPDAERREFARRTVAAFWLSAVRSLTLYPGVSETLQELKRQNVPVVAYTDAPIHEVTRRLRQLEIDRYITGIVARQWFRKRPVKTFAIYLHELPGYVRPPRRMKVLWRLGDADRKPNSAVYQRIARAFRMEPYMATVVGDSIPRDLTPAIEAGMTALWARYGQRDISNEKLLQSIVPNCLPEVAGKTNTIAEPAFPIDIFSEVLAYLPIQQLIQFDSNW